MSEIKFYNRQTKQIEIENVYGGIFVKLLYTRLSWLKKIFTKSPLLSKCYGWIQKLPITKRKIKPFVKKFLIDSEEFEKSIEEFHSFNDFFIRKLKASCRPFDQDITTLIAPADARYLVIPNLQEHVEIFVKGKTFSLNALVGDDLIAQDYLQGSMIIARLCPVDYHRFHFPCEGFAYTSKLIKGDYSSVNPIAIKKLPNIYAENKRMITFIDSKQFGKIVYIEVGATFVGSIKQTFAGDTLIQKGQEKGYFEFGGSCIIMLFKKQNLSYSNDLLKYSNENIETYLQLGQPIAHSLEQIGQS